MCGEPPFPRCGDGLNGGWIWLANTATEALRTENGVWLGGVRLRAAHALRDESEEVLPGMTARHFHHDPSHAALNPGADLEEL